MFRAAKALQKSTHLARPRVPAQLSSFSGGLGVTPSSDNNTNSTETARCQINPDQLLRSVYQTRGYTQYTGTNNTLSSGRRGFATSAGGSDDDISSDSVDSTLERLFRENEVVQGDATAQPWVDGIQSVASSGLDFCPTWYNPADWCIRTILQVQELGGLEGEIGIAIVGTTLALRVCLFPMVAQGQKAASRMAHLSPELKALQKKYEKVQGASMEQKQKMGEEVNLLFKKYDTHPLKSMTAPIIQLPFMMGMFFGLKKMPDYFPEEFASGGMYWLTDLSVPDPTYIMPAICMVSFAATVELGKEQMMASSPDSAPQMVMFMRGLAVMMGCVATTFPGGLVLYFTVTNTFTVCQIAVLKIPALKKALGIWDAPKAVPGAAPGETLTEMGRKLMDRAQGKVVDENVRMKQHNESIETRKRMTDMSKKRSERRRRSIKKRGGAE